MKFYVQPDPSDCLIRQGDIIWPVCFVDFSIKKATVIFKGEEEGHEVDLTTIDDPKEFRVLTSGQSCIGLILSQCCDLRGWKERPIVVARVRPCKDMKAFKADNINNVTEAIKNLANPGKSPQLFYLPENDDNGLEMQRSFACLLELQYFPPADLGALASLVKLRLSDSARQALQERVAYCFGRFGAPDDLFFSEKEWQHISKKNKPVTSA
jgi:hypothetical protein